MVLVDSSVWVAYFNDRQLRQRGITVRKTADVIIATYCIEHGLHLLYADRDFDPFVKRLKLRPALLKA